MADNLRRKCFKCGSSPGTDPDIQLFRFPKPGPKNTFRCEIWAKFCMPQCSWSSVDFQEKLHSEHRMLCNKHFAKNQFFYVNNQRKLPRDAVPRSDEELNTADKSVGTADFGEAKVITYDLDYGDYNDAGSNDDVQFLCKTEPKQNNPTEHTGFRCNSCRSLITGFRYVCVQCTDWDMCASCETRGEHPEHYVLRLPAPRLYLDTEPALADIREYINGLMTLKKEGHEIFFKEEYLDEAQEEPEDYLTDSLINDRSVPEAEHRQKIHQNRSIENVLDSVQTKEETMETSPPRNFPQISGLKTVSLIATNNKIIIPKTDKEKMAVQLISKPKKELASTCKPFGSSLLTTNYIQIPTNESSTEPAPKLIKIKLSNRKITILGNRKSTSNTRFRNLGVVKKS